MGAAALALSGCGGGGNVVDGIVCFPKEAQPFVFHESTATAADPGAKPTARATIYVDRSGSMAGYIAGSTADERPLQDLISVLPGLLERDGAKSGYTAFGTRITPQPATAREALMRREFYSCKGAAAGACDNQESRFDLVFEDIRRKPSDMALVVSDLWFVNSAVQTSALTDLAGPVGAILADGRGIAIYGIPARFKGPIFDLPAAPGTVPFDGRHPLFLVAVGSNLQLDRLHEQMKSSASPYLAGGLADGTIKRTLFTLDPERATAADAAPLKGNDPVISRTPVVASLPGVRIEQLQIGKSDALRARPAGPGLQWTGPAPASLRHDAVWSGTLEGRTRVWERRGDSCTPTDWIEGRPLAGLWRDAGAGLQRFQLDPRAVATGVGRTGTYLLSGEVHRSALLTPNPASAWMRDWSFSSRENPVGRSVTGTPFFPTLHLGEVARLMESALADAARRRPGPITGFSVIVKVTD